jgi:hypothetical protein
VAARDAGAAGGVASDRFLGVGTSDGSASLLSGIRKGLSDSGFVESQNLGIE